MEETLFSEFDFSLLEDPKFKEASVREELISPLIKYLGYSNSDNTEVIRDNGLKHPFVSIGSTRKRITIIPDYLMKVNGKPAWILEAKSPTESINETKHAEQAYSYAIHPEIRVNYFALCNGREFILYNISDPKPLIHIPLAAINQSKKFIREILNPSKIFTPKEVSLSKDLGLHAKRVGFRPSDSIFIIGCKPMLIIKYFDDLFSFSAPVGSDYTAYLGTFDFNLDTAAQLRPIIGDDQFAKLMQPTNGRQLQFHFRDEILLNVRVSLPEEEKLFENDQEIYLPLKVNEFVRL